MLSALRRLFRRVPPHLAGRVPVDAGVGVARDDYRIGYGPEIRPVVLTIRGDLTAKPRVVTPAPPLPSGARPDWAVREAERQMDIPLLAEILAGTCPHSDRPTPAENAKRYTREDGTW